MQLYLIILNLLIFGLGACLGSFVNMLVYRVRHNIPLGGRSFADATGKPLAAIDLIPIISFVIFNGRSRTNGEKLSILYPIIELLSASGLLIISWRFYDPTEPHIWLPFIVYTSYFTLFLAIAVYDYLYFSIPKNLTIVILFIAGLAAAINFFGSNNPIGSVDQVLVTLFIASIGTFVLSRIPITKVGSLDVLLVASLALVFSSRLLEVFFLSCVVGLCWGAMKMIKGGGLSTIVPLATILYFGSVAFLFIEILQLS